MRSAGRRKLVSLAYIPASIGAGIVSSSRCGKKNCYKVDPVVGPWNPVRRTGDLRTYFRASVAAGTNAFAHGGGRMPATCKAIVLLPLLPGRADLAACD